MRVHNTSGNAMAIFLEKEEVRAVTGGRQDLSQKTAGLIAREVFASCGIYPEKMELDAFDGAQGTLLFARAKKLRQCIFRFAAPADVALAVRQKQNADDVSSDLYTYRGSFYLVVKGAGADTITKSIRSGGTEQSWKPGFDALLKERGRVLFCGDAIESVARSW